MLNNVFKMGDFLHTFIQIFMIMNWIQGTTVELQSTHNAQSTPLLYSDYVCPKVPLLSWWFGTASCRGAFPKQYCFIRAPKH